MGSNRPADTLQLFGVGARADAMGDAFVAVANDATAAFWNPAGLALLPNAGVTAVTKTLPGTSGKLTFKNSNLSEYAKLSMMDLNPTNTSARSDSSTGTFYAATAPIGKGFGKNGTIGISHTLAGYFDSDFAIDGTYAISVPGSGELQAMNYMSHTKEQIDQTAITYGWASSNSLKLGFGIVMAEAQINSTGLATLTYDEPDPGVPGSTSRSIMAPTGINSDGKGYGFSLGTLWSPKWGKAGAWTVGASYMSKITFDSIDTASFGDESPDKILLGLSYKNQPSGNGSNNHVLWALQVSRSGSANTDLGDQLSRSAVWNFNIGGEYEIHKSGNSSGSSLYFPIRYGMFTNKSPNNNVYGDETWLTFGLGASRSDNVWQAELALQHALQNEQSLYSLSAVYSF